MSPRRTRRRRWFGTSTPDRLLPRDGGEDADVGGGERVGEVVLELGHLRDLGPGGELELVTAHVRAADRAQQAGLDPEVAQRLEQGLGGRVAVAHVGPWVGLALVERLARRQLVVDLLRLGDPVPGARLAHRSGVGGRGLALARAGCAVGLLVARRSLLVGELAGPRLGGPLLRGIVVGSHCDGVGLVVHQPLGLEGLGLAGPADGDLLAGGVAPCVGLGAESLGPHGARDVAGPGACPAHRPAGRAEHGGNRGPGQQQRSGDEHEQHEDVRPEPLEQGRRGPVEALPDGAAVLDHELLLEQVVAVRALGPQACGLGREREQQCREHEDAAGVERRRSLDQRPGDQRTSPGAERDRDHIGDPAERLREPLGDPAADPAAVPAEVEDEGEVDGRGDQGEADDVVVALLEPLDQVARVAARSASAAGRPAVRGPAPRRRARAAPLAGLLGPGEDHAQGRARGRPLRA